MHNAAERAAAYESAAEVAGTEANAAVRTLIRAAAAVADAARRAALEDWTGAAEALRTASIENAAALVRTETASMAANIATLHRPADGYHQNLMADAKDALERDTASEIAVGLAEAIPSEIEYTAILRAALERANDALVE